MLLSTKSVRLLANALKNISFSQYRELRQFTKTAEVFPLPEANNDEDIPKSIEKKTKFFTEQQFTTNKIIKRSDPDLPSPLAPVDPNDVPDIVPNFVPTFNFAAYVNKSESLQQLVKLGVDLSKIEKRKGLPEFVLKLDFEKDVKPYIIFLNDNGVEAALLGDFFTRNPLIFKEDLNNLQIRINYLEAKKFRDVDIKRILTKNAFWLMFPTSRIDKRLGYFQRTFKLSGDDVRFLASKNPRLITYQMEHIRKTTFCIKEEMGFDEDEIKCLLLSKPKLWMLKSDDLVERFAYILNVMKIPHDNIIMSPEILLSREFRLKQRHEFLKSLGKDQYDPGKDSYIPLKQLVAGNDLEFVMNVAKSDMKTYDKFLRTL